jgi:hypothetical protein
MMAFSSDVQGNGPLSTATGYYFSRGSAGVHACFVLNITSEGAGIRVDRINILPFDFGVSFDNFRTMRRCRLIWRAAISSARNLRVDAPRTRARGCRQAL